MRIIFEFISLLQGMSEDLPNIILFTNHDIGDHFSCYGGQLPTPNIDALAEKGVTFENNFCTAPQCSPSRGSILTGKMPHVNGLMGLTNLAWDLPENNKTIPKMLKEFGYSTHLIGLQHVHRDAKTVGYDTVSPRWDAPFFARAERRRLSKFFDKVENGEIKTPFYCDVGFFETHRPYISGFTMRPSMDSVEVPEYLVDTKDVRREIAKFLGSLKEFDKRFGQIMEDLQSRSFSKETLLIYTVDHGWPFPRAKVTMYEAGLRTALIMYWPGKIEGGKKVSCLTSGVDILPTIVDLIGKELPNELNDEIQGKSLVPVLEGRKNSIRDHILAELTYHDQGYNPVRAIRAEKWKYIRNFGPWDTQFQIANDYKNKPSANTYRQEHPEYSQDRPEEEFYNLEDDPLEQNNLAGNSEYKDIKEQMKAKLMEYMMETEDPVLDGFVPEPNKSKPLIF